MPRHPARLAALVIAVLCAAPGCRRRQQPPIAPPAPPAAAAPLTVTAGAELVFTYLGPDGRFRSTSKLEEIPPAARRVVRVVDPKRPPEQRGDLDRVHVVDLTQPGHGGAHPARLVERDVFESAAHAQLPPGDGTQFAFPKMPGARPGAGLPPAAGTAGPRAGAAPGSVAPNRDRIILYGTRWCGACAKARAYFKQRGIAFDDRDVEQDPAAAAELAAKATRAGVSPDRVPVLDVRGTLLQGFDQGRLEALLGVPI
ncbi:MAG TPA: glutaredoxin domain-containing protein [Polyangia bacterium]|jgi:glutaredoxin